MKRVEIKLTIGGGGVDVGPALRALGLDESAGEALEVAFLEDATVGQRLPLLEAGVVLRVRTGEEREESTVKLRPCRRSQLDRRWLAEAADAGRLRVEQDWSGARRVLAASCDADRPQGSVAAVRNKGKPIRRLFGAGQRRFLDDCAPLPINLDALTLLPAIRATKWKGVALPLADDGAGDVGVDAERWRVDRLDFLELSILVKRRQAEAAQTALEAAARQRGLEPAVTQQTKTRIVLEHLIDRHAPA